MLKLFLPLALVVTAPAVAQTASKVADLAWLEGSWEGKGVGGAPAIEVYSKAAGGALVGHFRQLNPDGSVMFYELITIGDVDGKLTYSLKHFNADLSGWEEKKEVRRFPLTGSAARRWVFSGITYERTGQNSMDVFVEIPGKDGKAETLKFQFRRKAR